MTSIHTHLSGKCPFQPEKSHEWCPGQPTDSRSPCPALNTLANHGYLPRNGKNIGFWNIVRALQEGYNLSFPLALFLTVGGFFLLKQWGSISLSDLARHQCIEHNASLVHHDAGLEDEYAPIKVDPTMVKTLFKNVPVPPGCTGELGMEVLVMDAEDIARERVRRERECPALDPVHAEIARGEMGIVLGIFQNTRGAGGKYGIPVQWLHEWIEKEKLPADWKPDHKQGLFNTMKQSTQIRNAMEKFRKADPANAPATLCSDVSVRVEVAPVEVRERTHVRRVSNISSSSSDSSFANDDGDAKSTPPTSRESSQEREADKSNEAERSS